MKLSICLPTYNRPNFVIKQLKFIQNEFKEFQDEIEVLVSDNCSDPDLRLELINYSSQNIFFELYLQESNLGLIGNTEFLLKRSNAEYIWFIGDDDVLEKGIVRRLFRVFKDFPDIFYIFFNHSCFKNHKNNIVNSFNLENVAGYINNGTKQMFNLLKKHGTISMFMTANIYKRTNLLEKNKNLNRALVIEDFLWFSFISANSGPMYIIPEIFIHDNLTKASWSNSSRRIFGIDIPQRLIEFDDLLNHNINISKELMEYYKAGRGHFLYMLFFSKNKERLKILKFLGLKYTFILIVSSFYLSVLKIHDILFRKLHRDQTFKNI